VHDLLEMADDGQHRQHRLHQHAVLPRAALTQFEVAWITLGSMETGITQDNHALLKLPNQPLKGIIRDIGGGTRPGHYQPLLLEQQTQLTTNDPAGIGETLAADLLRAAALAHGVDQLDAVGVNDPQHGWRGQEDLRPVLMGREEATEPRPLRSAGEQGAIVACQPAIKGPVAHTFEGME
jgi:hypothetical protein